MASRKHDVPCKLLVSFFGLNYGLPGNEVDFNRQTVHNMGWLLRRDLKLVILRVPMTSPRREMSIGAGLDDNRKGFGTET